MLVNIKGQQNIESTIAEYKFDDNFITVSQVAPAICKKISLDSINEKKYYLIDVKKNILKGPLDKNSFDSLLNKLELDKNLYLQ